MRGIRGGVPGWNAGVGNLASAATTTRSATRPARASGRLQQRSSSACRANLLLRRRGAASFASLFGAASKPLPEPGAVGAGGRKGAASWCVEPRVITADQVKALIEQGRAALPDCGATRSQFRNVAPVKRLKRVTPQIAGGSVILVSDVNKTAKGTTSSAGFAINTNEDAGAGGEQRHRGDRRHR